MVSGEYLSTKTLFDTLPDAVPEPIAWGTYASDPNIHFFLCSFVDMTDDLPGIQPFTAKVAELHKKGLSPNGKHGFSVPTLQGTIPHYTTWTESWEEFFTNSIKRVMDMEEASQGFDEEMKELCPRLLRPLETRGRQIQPRLIHGDIWDGNTATFAETGAPVIFDATCIYAHSECECNFSTGETLADRTNGACPMAADSTQDDYAIRESVFPTLPCFCTGGRSRRPKCSVLPVC